MEIVLKILGWTGLGILLVGIFGLMATATKNEEEKEFLNLIPNRIRPIFDMFISVFEGIVDAGANPISKQGIFTASFFTGLILLIASFLLV